MKKYAIIVAGGKGVRMGMALPKQFLPLAGKPVLYHTVKAFADAYEDMNIILVLPEDQLSYAQIVLQAFQERIDVTIVSGGETRFHSVQNGLKAVEGDAVIFVHDGVRPIITKELIQKCYVQAIEKGSAIPAVAVTDSIRLIQGDTNQPVDRTKLRSIQTPQTFRSEILLPAFEQVYRDEFTDEATVVEMAGHEVHLIEGDKKNIKLTTPEDMEWAEMMLKGSTEDV